MDTGTSSEGRSRFVITGDAPTYHVSQSRIRRNSRRTDNVLFACALIAVLGLTGIFRDDSSSKGEQEGQSSPNPLDATWFYWSLAILAIATAVTLIIFLIARRQYMANENKHYNEILKAEEEYKREVLEKLKKETELATLMGLNQGQINEYHRIVTDQADKAFRSSRIAMNVGLLLLVSAAFAGAYVPLEEMRWFIGALAAFSTLLSGYLSKTYLTLYRESIGQLNRYFDQPVLNSHYLTAERLAEALDRPDAIEVRRQIIDEVLAASAKVGTKGGNPNKEPSPTAGKPKKRKIPKQGKPSSVNGQPV
ncbi:hypothetical protein ACIPC1_07375 [Streptomyces sp. NPDC087263]|uniref:hypothetical protein n=1 Tax=Streptomyces sp. NPDC087263 TaxID=3365773 RepID=UPI0037F71C56